MNLAIDTWIDNDMAKQNDEACYIALHNSSELNGITMKHLVQ